ncbi:MAG: RNA polymerase sigma factor [Isosphaeraceae bacterium]
MDNLRERLARGDRAAFAELYDACAARAHHYLVARLGSRTDADDVLQETFVRLARDRRKLAHVENLLAYVVATARNEASRLIERRLREDRRRMELASEMRTVERANAEGVRDAAEQVALLMEKLDPPLREIVELKVFGGLTFREISEVTGLPRGTVATRYRSALETMRGQPIRDWQ